MSIKTGRALKRSESLFRLVFENLNFFANFCEALLNFQLVQTYKNYIFELIKVYANCRNRVIIAE